METPALVKRVVAVGDTTIDRALADGAAADRLGFAFAAGYREALRALVPAIHDAAALCITEDGGNHPRAIATALVEIAPGAYELTGKKTWATGGPQARTLLVAASIGAEAGHNRLRLVRVRADAPGVRIVAMTAPFVPEIEHAEVVLERVAIRDEDLLPGDGYTTYVKPFRTIEDLHVHGALLGYLIGVARRHALSRGIVERLLALAAATRALASRDRDAAETHVVLAGTLALVMPVVAELETAWAVIGGDEHQRWQRDRALLQVAGKAREARLARAWARLEVR